MKGSVIQVPFGSINNIPSIPNRAINPTIVESISSQLETETDVLQLPPLHVIQGPNNDLSILEDEYGLVNGFHRQAAIEKLVNRLSEGDEETIIDLWASIEVPVLLRSDLQTREDIIAARFDDNRSHGSPPTAEERRNHALWLANTYGYGKPDGISQIQIGKMTGLDNSTVSKLLKRTLNKEGETTREGTYSETLHASSSTLVRSIEKFFSEEKAFFSFSGTSDKDVKHRSKQLATIYQEKGYDPKHLEAIGKSILEAYGLIVQSGMSKTTHAKPEDVQKLLVQEKDNYSITRNGVTYTLPPKK